MPDVYDMITGEFVASYVGIPAKEAVMCAYQQKENNNYNHWDYDYTKVEQCQDKVYFGKYCAINDL